VGLFADRTLDEVMEPLRATSTTSGYRIVADVTPRRAMKNAGPAKRRAGV
jgi:hypothetical protein